MKCQSTFRNRIFRKKANDICLVIQRRCILLKISFIRRGKSTTVDVCCNQLDKIMKELGIKKLRLVSRDRSIFWLDQMSLFKLQELYLEALSHAPYSSDLAPPDYHFVQTLNHFLQRKYLVPNKL